MNLLVMAKLLDIRDFPVLTINNLIITSILGQDGSNLAIFTRIALNLKF